MKYRIREQNELKPSGVEWLGDIPKDWNISKLKFISNIVMGQSPSSTSYNDKEIGLPLIQGNADCKDRLTLPRNFTSEITKVCNIGDIILTVRAPVGAVSKSLHHACIGRGVCSINSKKNNQFLYYYLIFHEKLWGKFTQGSIYESVSIDVISNTKIPFINIIEQQKIADFLDEKSKIFDEAISKKEQLISKLELAKQSLISEVVTGKLKIVEQNSKLQTIKREQKELKPSGVEWLGNIPKDWKVKKSKYLFEIRKRIAGILGFDVLSITQKGIKIKDIETGGGQLSMDYSKYQIVNIGDFAMNHMDLLTGFVDIAKSQGVTSPDYRVFSLVDKNSDSIYYLYLFQMGYKNQIFFAFGQGSSQLGRWRFPTEEFNKFYFPYPSLEEQQKISRYLDKKLIHFDNTIEKTKQSITKLKEAKEALISQAVTGKIEVL